MSKYLIREIKTYECVNCGWRQKIWNYKVSQIKCSCGGKGLRNWRVTEENANKFAKTGERVK